MSIIREKAGVAEPNWPQYGGGVSFLDNNATIFICPLMTNDSTQTPSPEINSSSIKEPELEKLAAHSRVLSNSLVSLTTVTPRLEPVILKGRTLIPLRFEAFNCKVV